MKMNIQWWGMVLLGSGLSWVTSCFPTTSDLVTSEGEAIARTHCGGCHQFPEPALLDETTWREGVLPVMGLHLGRLTAASGKSQQNLQTLLLEGDYPRQPLLLEAEWEKLIAYY